MEKLLAELVNLLWKKCIQSLGTCLDPDEITKFSNNDYYYMLVIDSLNSPNFTEISEALGVTKPAVSSIIKKLSGIGLISKVQSESDRRIFNVIISEKGRKILDGDYEMYHEITDIIKEVAADDHEIAVVNRILSEIVHRMEKEYNDKK